MANSRPFILTMRPIRMAGRSEGALNLGKLLHLSRRSNVSKVVKERYRGGFGTRPFGTSSIFAYRRRNRQLVDLSDSVVELRP